MAWSTPRTWVAGDVLTAAQLNQDVRDNSKALKAGAHVMASGVVTQTAGNRNSTTYAAIPTVTAVTFVKASADTDLFFDVMMTCYATTGITQCLIGVNYDGTAGNTVKCAQLTFNETASHKVLAGSGTKTGLAAGSYTCSLYWSSAGPNQFNTDGNDWASLKVTEAYTVGT